MTEDPVVTNADAYQVLFENDRVRVLEYHDRPGHRTTPHSHPDSVMYTLTSFRRKLVAEDRAVEVEIPAGSVRWISAQRHAGENVGDTATRSIFVELKEPPPSAAADAAPSLGPST